MMPLFKGNISTKDHEPHSSSLRENNCEFQWHIVLKAHYLFYLEVKQKVSVAQERNV